MSRKSTKVSKKSQKAISSNVKGKVLNLSYCKKNAFRNFIREFQRRNNDLDKATAVKLGAKAWCLLYEEERDLLKELVC